MKTREATTSDALAIAEVHVASWQTAYKHLLPAEWLASMSIVDRRAKWEEIIYLRQSEVLVAVHNGKVIGFAFSGPSRDHDAALNTHELFALYVHPDAWSGRYGWSLWQSVRQSAERQDAQRCTLWAIVGNDRGVKFYERVGFGLEPGSRQNFEIAGVPLQEDRYALSLTQNGA
jgi:GNAT superfamily N-acetyltransferase